VQEIKGIKKELESNKPDKDKNDNPDNDEPDDSQPNPSDKKEKKFIFYGDCKEKSGYSKFGGKEENFLLFYVSKNHPQIKKLADQGKLQNDKQFTIRYGKVDNKSDKGSTFTFNEDNQELEIIEVGNPNPQPGNKGFNYVSTKINDNTYKYKVALDVNGSEIDFANFIIFLRTKDKNFFQAFQGALKDANAKFPGYF